MSTQTSPHGRLIDCTVFSSSFPGAVPNEISRDSVLNGIEDFFESGIQWVTLEGRQDVGKTRIISQFAQRHSKSCISVFVTPNSWFVQDSSLLLADLAGQMYFALNSVELPNTLCVD